MGFCFHYPFPGLVFKEWLDERIQGMNVPGLVDKMDSSEAGRKAVLGGKKETHTNERTSQVRGEQPASLRLKHQLAEGETGNTLTSQLLRSSLFPLPPSSPEAPQLRNHTSGLSFPSHNYMTSDVTPERLQPR